MCGSKDYSDFTNKPIIYNSSNALTVTIYFLVIHSHCHFSLSLSLTVISLYLTLSACVGVTVSLRWRLSNRILIRLIGHFYCRNPIGMCTHSFWLANKNSHISAPNQSGNESQVVFQCVWFNKYTSYLPLNLWILSLDADIVYIDFLFIYRIETVNCSVFN